MALPEEAEKEKWWKPGRKTVKAAGHLVRRQEALYVLLAPEDIAAQDNVDICHNHPDVLRKD